MSFRLPGYGQPLWKLFGFLLCFAATLLLAATGCSRSWHRHKADQRAYSLIKSRQIDPRWQLPDRTVEPDPNSRMADFVGPDCGPKPADDPAADQFTREPKTLDNSRYYDSIATRSRLENDRWFQTLPRDESGKILLTEETVVGIALLHSREFQTEVEGLYLNSLGLSSDRFAFATQWFGSSDGTFDAVGDAPSAVRTLIGNGQLGFVRALAAGGELTTTLANSFVWEFGNGPFNMASGSLVVGLTQPLLSGAFRHVQLNGLTLSERALLYDVRDFARFRRAFYQGVATAYLGLLTQIQAKRNQERNLESLEINLEEFSERLVRGQVSQIQYDQVFQDVQNGRIDLLAAEQGLEDAFDAFKFQLGLPAWVEISLDESLLEPFELSDPQLEKLQEDAQSLYQQLTQTLPPEVPKRSVLVKIHREMIKLNQRAIELMPGIITDVDKWKGKLDALKPEDITEDDRLDIIQQRRLLQQVERLAKELSSDLENDLEVAQKWDVDDPVKNRELSNLFFTVEDYLAGRSDTDEDDSPGPEKAGQENNVTKKELTEDERLIESWTQLTRMLGRRLRERLANMFVVQTQTRLFFIDVKRSRIQQTPAVMFALENRLDLKNVRGALTDAFRNVEVAADALQSGLSVTGGASLGTDNDNAFRFDSDANSYTLGLQFDGPLNRFNEGNAYRASQIAYQAARRDLMAAQDGITNEIRSDLRALRISRLNFQIGRQQLISAIRQVDEAQIRLRTATDGANDSSPTQDLLDALSGLLAAKNALISNRIGHEIARINLFVDLELLYLDDEGRWINRDADPAEFTGSGQQTQASLGSDIEFAEQPVVAEDSTIDPNTPPADSNDAQRPALERSTVDGEVAGTDDSERNP